MPGAAETTHDLFLSYHGADRNRVEVVRRALVERGISAFLDRHDLSVGLPWPQGLERALRSVHGVLVFVGAGHGAEGLGLWQRREVWFALDRQAQEEGQGKSFPVVPVLLRGGQPDAGFLFLNTWVDLRDSEVDPPAIDAIVNVVTGTAPTSDALDTVAISPYRGLEPFREEHAAIFFGRESFAGKLLDRVLQYELVALVGASGSGKSSIVQAGLIPLLRRQRPPQRAWDAIVFRPGDEPFHRLAAALVPLLEPDADEIDRLTSARKLGERLGDGSVRLTDVIDRIIARSHGTDRLLLVADQFEELLTLAPPAHRTPFVTALLDALDRAPVTVLLTLRADFYAPLIQLDRSLSDRLPSGLVNLGPMTGEELRRAIEQPAARARAGFETGLVDRILAQVATQPGSLPLLEFALTELWQQRTGREITHAAFEAIGEVSGAISKRAEAVYLGLNPGGRRAASTLFTRLVRVAAPGDSEPDTRRRIAVEALTESERGVLKPFADARLVVLDRDEGGAQTVEVAHEALIRSWQRFREWVNQQRDFLLWRQRLTQSLVEWIRTGRDKEALLRGPALKEAKVWAHDRASDLSSAETDYIAVSLRKVRQRRRWKQSAIALVVALAALWPALKIVSNLDASQVRIAVLAGPMWFSESRYESSANWIHVVDIAGHMEKLGSQFLGFPPAPRRLVALETAATLMAYQGRMVEAQRLADKAMEVAKEAEDFDSVVFAQVGMANMLIRVGRLDEARPFAKRALALAEAAGSADVRALHLTFVALTLAESGLKSDALAAIESARRATSESNTQMMTRAILDSNIATALAALGQPDEAMQLVMAWQIEGPPLLRLIQTLLDHGYTTHARKLAEKFNDALALAMVASALASQGSPEDAGLIARRAFGLIKGPTHVGSEDQTRRLVTHGLLLNVMTAGEVAAFVRDRNKPEELAILAGVFARTDSAGIGHELAKESKSRAAAIADENERARALTLAVIALARLGEAESALGVARSVVVEKYQTMALAHAAYGFAEVGMEEQAKALIAEVEKALPSVRDPHQRDAVRTTLTVTQVRLGRYTASDEATGLPFDARLAISATVMRDAALRRDSRLREAFDRRPAGKALGRYGLHW